MHLILAGLRGCGKSTIGRSAAESLSRAFVDLDDRTEALLGMPAATCFRDRGEEAWRLAEATALETALAETTPGVIALGGGTPIAPGAETMLLEARRTGRARVGWLDAPAETLVTRIEGDPGRPALTDLPPLEEMIEIARRRRPVLERIADRRFDTVDRSEQEVVDELVGWMSTG